MIERILLVLVNGLFTGSIAALVAIGLNVQYGVGKVFNIAYGDFIMLGAFTTYVLCTRVDGMNPLTSLPISGLILFALGFVLYRTLFTSLRKRALSPAVFEGNSLLVAFGLMFIIQNIALLIWGGRVRMLFYLNYPVYIGGMVFAANKIASFGMAIGLAIAFYVFVTRSRLGKAIRAAAQDTATAGLMGIDINMVLATCFGLGALLAGFAGTVISIQSAISEIMGLTYTISAIIVMVLGGLGSIPGSFVGGLIVGIVGSIVTLYQPALVVPAYYALFLILLLAKPTGIFGKA